LDIELDQGDNLKSGHCAILVEPALFFEAWFNMSYSKSILLFLGFTSLSVITGSGAEVSGEKEVL